MKGNGTKVLSVFLALLMVLQGCKTVGMKYHDIPGNRGAVKIYPFWERGDGKKYLVGGLRVELFPRDQQDDRTFKDVTNTDTHLYIDDLVPGRYRLKVYIEGGIEVAETLEVLSGKSLTVRIDVEGVKSKEAFKDSLESIGDTIKDAFVFVGGAVVVLSIVALSVTQESRDKEK